MPVKIPLFGRYGEGQFALVDDADAPGVSHYSWHLTPNGYVSTTVYVGGPGYDQTHLRMHRLLCPNGRDTDHINGIRTDNRRSNLRPATRSQNNQNQRVTRSDNTSGYRGVVWHAAMKRWRARVTVDGKERVRYFRTKEAAAEAVKTMRATYMTHAPEAM